MGRNEWSFQCFGTFQLSIRQNLQSMAELPGVSSDPALESYLSNERAVTVAERYVSVLCVCVCV